MIIFAKKRDRLQGYNRSSNDSDSNVYQSVQSISGSGMADILQAGTERLTVTAASRRGYSERYTINDIKDAGRNTSTVTTKGGTVGAGGSSHTKYSANGKMASASINGGNGGSYSTGDNEQTAGFIDMNGDGLPDYVDNGAIKMNLGRNAWRDKELDKLEKHNLSEGDSRTVGISLSISTGGGGGGKKDINNSEATATVSAGISGGVNYSVSVMQTKSMLIDMNGDGLPDLVSADNGVFTVRYNLGDRFQTQTDGDETPVFDRAPGWPIDGEALVRFTTLTDGNLLTDVFKNLPLVGNKVSSAVDNLFSGKGVTINPYGSKMGDYLNKLETNSSITVGLSASANVGGTMKIPLPPTPLSLDPSVGGGGGIMANANLNGVTMRLMDMDGDGLPDRVLRIPGTNCLWVQRNLSGRVGLLRMIHIPQGGAYALDYAWEKGTNRMPQSRYVLSGVTMKENPGLRRQPGGAHEYTTRYAYHDGYYDRTERAFYGFTTVTAYYADGGKQETWYYNDRYYRHGMARQQTRYDKDGNVLQTTLYETDAYPYARVLRQETQTREARGDGGTVRTEQRYEYDEYGNITVLRDYADGTAVIRAQITYTGFPAGYLHAHPQQITVYEEGSGPPRLLRQRTGTYNTRGSPVTLQQYYGEGHLEYAQTRLQWDEYGNLAQVITENSGGKERWVRYEYDAELHQYVETITQGGTGISGGYSSQTAWDKARGVKAAETDENGQIIKYTYDEYGRLLTVRSPYDGDTGTAAVEYAYYTEEDINWYAVTKNKVRFDSDNQDVITTVLQADSLGRKLYAAKSGQVRQARGWNVSGAAEYDGKGRAVKTGQPYFVAGTDVKDLLAGGIRMVNATEQEYDSLDRVVQVTLPDGARERIEYGIRAGQRYDLAVDANGNRSERVYDGRMNTVRTARYGNSGGAALTGGTFAYNGLGEMLQAFDAAGNPLTFTYDLLGRRLSMESADSGKSEYVYDRAGNLVEETNSELHSRGQYIKHEYDGMNRLVKTVYPTLQTAVYEYGLPEETEHRQAGRLIRLTDSSGVVEYEYGKLGETVKERKTLNKQTGASRTRTAVFQYRGNYLGQMESITYPDGEEVSYAYDYGGNVTGVTGKNRKVDFTYVKQIDYDEWGQRVYLQLGNDTETWYTYNEKRRWLDEIQTKSGNTVLQNIQYRFDPVGNVLGYTNNAGTYQTKQDYSYDNLYQLTGVEGETTNRRFGMTEYTGYYTQQYRFDSEGLGNMTLKSSSTAVNPPRLLGDPLDYQLNYEYEAGYAHRASRIGNQYYRYDLNGSVTAVQDHPFEPEAAHGNPTVHDLGDNTYYTEGGWGLNEPKAGTAAGTAAAAKSRKEYRWDDKNRLQYSNDGRYSVRYTYGEDGERTGKWVNSNVGGESESLYFGKLWTWHYDGMAADYTGMNSKHIFVGETRIATKVVYADGSFIRTAEEERQFYYHSDHLGSAQLITDYKGREYERFEYTPYGELWVEKASAASTLDVPYRFTGKERDKETGLYYYGARYLDPRDSRWLSVDPAMGEYIPQAPVNDEARKHNQNLPGMGGVFNTVNFHVYHYAGNNPVKYTDPDGREEKIPVILIGAQGTKAHNTAYGRVAQFIMGLGYQVKPNNGMRKTIEGEVVSKQRPDWQGFASNNKEVKYWELKQKSPWGESSAIKDIRKYIDSARAMGINAQVGEALGPIAENVPVNGMDGVFMDINSPSPGVILYNAYIYGPDLSPIPVEINQETVLKILAVLAAVAGALSGVPSPVFD